MARKGWSRESARHSLAARGCRTAPTKSRCAPRKSAPKLGNGRISISENNWSVECDPDGSNAKLHMDDHIGWRWSGDETDWDIFIMRMAKSKVTDDFVKAMEDAGLDYEVIKKIITDKDYDLNSAVYSLTGDNVFWHFGETGDQEYETIRSYGEDEFKLDREQVDEFTEYFWRHEKMEGMTDFDTFKESDEYTRIEKEVRESFKNANTWQQVVEEFSSEGWAENAFEVQDQWISSRVYPELERIGKLWAEEHPKEIQIAKLKKDQHQKKLEVGG